LSPDFYADSAVVSALRSHEFGPFFKIARFKLGLTQERFGLLVGLAQSRVCKIENGAVRLRDIGTIARLAVVLGMPPELLGFTTLDGGDEKQAVSWLQRRDFVRAVTAIALGASGAEPLHDRLSALVPEAGVESPRRIGIADVERIEATTAAFRDWDNRWGGGLSRAAVLGQLRWLIATSKHAVVASEAIQRRLLVATADLANLGAWINYDVERHDEARQLWMIALDASREANNIDLVSDILRELAHQALHLKRPDEALALVRLSYAIAADPRHDAPELALSEISAYEAWCHAAAGNLQACQRAIGHAEDHFASAQGEAAAPWLAHFDDAELYALRGHAYHVLAKRMPHAAEMAQPWLRRAVEQRGAQYARSKTLNLIALSSTYFQSGDGLEEGVRVGDEALEGAGTLKSPRALSRLRDLDRTTASYAQEAGVAEFRARLHRVLTDVG
jgi:transcriptional regulator with XRE-family HTH domain